MISGCHDLGRLKNTVTAISLPVKAVAGLYAVSIIIDYDGVGISHVTVMRDAVQNKLGQFSQAV